MKNYKQILEAVNQGLRLVLDDFDDELPIQQEISKVKIKDSLATFQKNAGQTLITQKIFIYELLKRIHKADKKIFKDFGFVNYKVTGNENDWPYIVSLNQKMSDRLKEKYQDTFDIAGWTTINGYTNSRLIKASLGYSGETNGYTPQEYINNFTKDYPNWKEEQFKGKFNDCLEVVKKLITIKPQLEEKIKSSIFWIDQISFSNDGAFYVIIYQVYGDYGSNKTINHVDIFSTSDIIPEENGLDFDESKNIKDKQRKFKAFLKKAIYTTDDKGVPANISEGIINGHACFNYSVGTREDLDYRLRCYQRLESALDIFGHNIIYNEKTMNALMFMRSSTYDALYIETREDVLNIYDKLRINSKAPYIVASSKNGKYLIAFYQETTNYNINKAYYKITYSIIDNQDFSIMPEDYLERIKYNYVR